MDVFSFLLGVAVLYISTYFAVFLVIATIFVIIAYLAYRAVRIK